MSPYWTRDRHADRRPFLLGRARIVAAIRAWFAAEGFVEVEPDALVLSPGAEVHLQAVAAGGRYLHTSPEFAMKKLLAAGEEKIFFLGKVWRAGEEGPLHASEFTMLEWYRAGASYQRVMQDCVELVHVAANAGRAGLFIWRDRICDPLGEAVTFTVREAFARYGVSPPPKDSGAFSAAIVGIEPHLGVGAPLLLTEYPITEAALARPAQHDPSVAERFELYACGVELANGFGELTDPVEQRARLEAAMAQKEKIYGAAWPIDEDFLAALAHMPPASGVALGLDRLAMLATGARSIQDVLWTPKT